MDVKRRVIGIFLILLGVVAAAQIVFLTYQQRESSRCQAQFNLRFAKVVEERSDISNREISDMQNLLLEVNRINLAASRPGADMATLRAEYRQLLVDYSSKAKETQKERRSHKFPNASQLAECTSNRWGFLPNVALPR